MKRVVITGMAGLSPIGVGWDEVEKHLREYRSGVRFMPEWDIIQGLNTRLGAAVPPFDLPAHYDRRRMRSLGRVGMLATRASELAIEDAGLLGDPLLKSGQMGGAFEIGRASGRDRVCPYV